VELKTTERIQAILSAIIDEDVVPVPLSYELSQITSALKVENLKKSKLIAAFRSLDYMITQSYYDPKLFKTNAPPEVIYDIFKAWVGQLKLKGHRVLILFIEK
jgi:tRNA (guanine26-N2/guanine27-N2)-dimethyltransferase